MTSLITQLFDCGAVKIDTQVGFKLKHHDTNPTTPLSPIYLNLRTPENPKPGPLTAELVSEIGRMLWIHAKGLGLEFDAICGLPNAGTPLAKAFWQALYDDGQMVPNIILGKTETADGSRRIEGVLEAGGAIKGDKVLVIDDLITRALSKLEGIEALESAGFEVTDVLVLVDREQGGKDDLDKRGIRLSNLMTLKGIVNKLFEASKISITDGQIVCKYLAA